jgi:hypothetical protein
MHGMLDGAARAPAFTPQYHDPSDDGGETVPDEVWATDEFQVGCVCSCSCACLRRQLPAVRMSPERTSGVGLLDIMLMTS